MEVVELLQTILKALGGVATEVLKHYIELAAAAIGLTLVVWKTYAFSRERILRKVRLFMLGEEGFWDRTPSVNITQHIREIRKSIPILMVANYKGGVAKSTIVANLAAHYDSIGLRVMMIDFDYQGTLTDATVKKDGSLVIGASSLNRVGAGAAR